MGTSSPLSGTSGLPEERARTTPHYQGDAIGQFHLPCEYCDQRGRQEDQTERNDGRSFVLDHSWRMQDGRLQSARGAGHPMTA